MIIQTGEAAKILEVTSELAKLETFHQVSNRSIQTTERKENKHNTIRERERHFTHARVFFNLVVGCCGLSLNKHRPQAHSAHGILLGPASCSCLVLVPVGLVHMSNLRHQWIIGVRIRQQRTD
ncbi:hypothetical protein OIU84_007771 [Salix udensis]|uniref:Uncharacterized protein n=1 Tax=Salix udensis TaxID=889485 RepID=A0AAD6JTL3_9ROSI|nr:hypothetical protein OIU84_007771 [Salix udensis]